MSKFAASNEDITRGSVGKSIGRLHQGSINNISRTVSASRSLSSLNLAQRIYSASQHSLVQAPVNTSTSKLNHTSDPNSISQKSRVSSSVSLSRRESTTGKNSQESRGFEQKFKITHTKEIQLVDETLDLNFKKVQKRKKEIELPQSA